MLIQMVDLDLGVTILPQMAIDAGILKGTQIETVSLPINRYFRDIGFMWRRQSFRESFVLSLAELLPHGNLN